MSTIRWVVASSSSTNGPSCMIPALLTRTSTGPSGGLGVVDEAVEGGAVGDVERERDGAAAELLRRGLRGLEVEVADRDLHALAHERPGGRLADAAGAAGDERDLTDEDAGLLGHGREPTPCGRLPLS